MGAIVGIDLGTTNSALAILDDAGRPTIVENASMTPKSRQRRLATTAIGIACLTLVLTSCGGTDGISSPQAESLAATTGGSTTPTAPSLDVLHEPPNLGEQYSTQASFEKQNENEFLIQTYNVFDYSTADDDHVVLMWQIYGSNEIDAGEQSLKLGFKGAKDDAKSIAPLPLVPLAANARAWVGSRKRLPYFFGQRWQVGQCDVIVWTTLKPAVVAEEFSAIQAWLEDNCG